MDEYSQGVCHDGAAILRNGVMLTVDEIVERLNRLAALEAEKAERERQEPVAWAWNDALGCMHAHCGSRRPVWVDGECSDAKRAETSLRPLYAAPPIPRVELTADRDEIHRALLMTTDERNRGDRELHRLRAQIDEYEQAPTVAWLATQQQRNPSQCVVTTKLDGWDHAELIARPTRKGE